MGIKVHVTTSKYDGAIANFLNKEKECSSSFSISEPLVSQLRYGENSHQSGALYGKWDEYFEKRHGKELSYNNILDITAALLEKLLKDELKVRSKRNLVQSQVLAPAFPRPMALHCSLAPLPCPPACSGHETPPPFPRRTRSIRHRR